VTGSRPSASPHAGLGTLAREWTRIGLISFGGPPTQIALLRALVADREGWLDARAFEDANAACGLLPGPAATQLAIFCAYRVAGPAGAVVGGLGFVLPAVVMIIALSVLFLSSNPPTWVRGAGAGAGAVVAAVAVRAGFALLEPSWRRAGAADRERRAGEPRPLARGLRGHARAGAHHARRSRWLLYVAAGMAGAVALSQYLVVVLLGAGALELVVRRHSDPHSHVSAGLSTALMRPGALPKPTLLAAATGGLGALAWTAFKVGALAFGGGFVIIPLMQGDAVHVYHWMTGTQFLNAVALGQLTPGPVVATVAAVGYAAHGLLGALLAALIAFAPSFGFVVLGGARFEGLRADGRARAFLDGAGPAAIGAILGAAITLAAALRESWQVALLALGALALLVVRRGVVETLLGAGAVGAFAAIAGAPLP
jgi:chromate transporter